jgi:hypothetical protein
LTDGGRRSFVRATAAGVALLAVPGAARTALRDAGEVELRVTDHRAGIEDFHAVDVSLTDVSLHPAGRTRGEGWVPALSAAPAVDIVPLKDGRWTAAGTARVPAQRYDAIRIAAAVSRGRRKTGAALPIAPASATVAIGLVVDVQVRVPILLDFYLEDQTEHHPPRYALKLRRVSVGAAGRTP